MKKISVLSGGLDSTILTYKLVEEFGRENVLAVTYYYGQNHDIEIEKAKLTCQKLDIEHILVDISFLGGIAGSISSLCKGSDIATPDIKEILGEPQPVTYVPYRNQILTSIAMSIAESRDADEVYLGLQSQDEYAYWDTSSYFVEAMNDLSNLNRIAPVRLVAPFSSMSKADEIRIGVELGVPFEDTWTCYRGEQGHGACGTCPSCADRIANFIKAGIKDPLEYEIGDKIPWQLNPQYNSQGRVT